MLMSALGSHTSMTSLALIDCVFIGNDLSVVHRAFAHALKGNSVLESLTFKGWNVGALTAQLIFDALGGPEKLDPGRVNGELRAGCALKNLNLSVGMPSEADASVAVAEALSRSFRRGCALDSLSLAAMMSVAFPGPAATAVALMTVAVSQALIASEGSARLRNLVVFDCNQGVPRPPQ